MPWSDWEKGILRDFPASYEEACSFVPGMLLVGNYLMVHSNIECLKMDSNNLSPPLLHNDILWDKSLTCQISFLDASQTAYCEIQRIILIYI